MLLIPLAANDMGAGMVLAWEAMPAEEKDEGDVGRTPRALICCIIWARLLFIADEAILEAAERLVPDKEIFQRATITRSESTDIYNHIITFKRLMHRC